MIEKMDMEQTIEVGHNAGVGDAQLSQDRAVSQDQVESQDRAESQEQTVKFLLSQARNAMDEWEWTDAITHCQKAVALAPDDHRAQWMLMEALYWRYLGCSQQEDYGHEAAAACRVILQRDPNCADALYILGRITGDRSQQIEAYQMGQRDITRELKHTVTQLEQLTADEVPALWRSLMDRLSLDTSRLRHIYSLESLFLDGTLNEPLLGTLSRH